MNLSDGDRRALTWLAVSLVLSLILYQFSNSGGSTAPKVVAAVDSVESAERMLTRLRTQAATVPGKEAVLKQVSTELDTRERRLIKGDTAAQAQAQVLQVLREVARTQTPPLDIRQVELGLPLAYGDNYGQVSVSVTLDCRIDQLVNYLAFLSNQPEILSTDQIRFVSQNAKLKNNQVRLTISGLVPRKLVPVRKGIAAF